MALTNLGKRQGAWLKVKLGGKPLASLRCRFTGFDDIDERLNQKVEIATSRN